MSAEIVIQNPNRYPECGARRLRPWLEALVDALLAAPAADLGPRQPRRPAPRGAPARGVTSPGVPSLGVRFAGDRWLRRLNRTYRGRDRTTDVLSFPGAQTPEGPHLGDIAISVPAARRQAAAAARPIEEELRVLLLHGVLHCLGYDHESDDGTMERLEKRLRRSWVGKRVPA